MKNLIIAIAFLISAFASKAQIIEHHDMAKGNFTGLENVDGKLFYTVQSGESIKDMPYNFIVHTFDSELNRVANERVPVKWGGEFVQSIAHNGGILLYFKNSKEGLLYCFDKNGKKAWNKTITVDKPNMNKVNMVSLGKDGFAIARPDKEKKNGFRVTMYDNAMNEKWVYSDFPEKGLINISDIKSEGDKLAVLTESKPAMFSNSYEHSVYMLSGESGSLLYKQMIVNNETKSQVEDFNVNADGSTFFIGYRYNPKSQFDGMAIEMFYKSFDNKGNLVFEESHDLYGDFGMALTSNRVQRIFNFNTPPVIKFHEIIKTKEGYSILGELYKYILKPVRKDDKTITTDKPATLYVLDYVVINISNSGQINQVNRITKPYKVIDMNGFSITTEAQAHRSLEKYKFFAYRYLDINSKTPQMVSLNWSQSSPYIGFTSLDVTHENILNRQFIDIKIADRSTGEITFQSFKTPGVSDAPFIDFYNVVPFHKQGKVLYAEYNNGNLFLRVMDLQPKDPVPVNGELAIQGIPGGDFKGLKAIGDHGFYNFYFSETTDDNSKIFVYQKFDNELNTLGKDLVVVPDESYFVGNVASGKEQVLVFGNSRKRTWYFYSMNESGKLVSQNRIELDTSVKLVTSGNMILDPATDGFYIIQPFYNYETRVNGFEVIRMNAKCEVRWTFPYYVESTERFQLLGIDNRHGVFAFIHNKMTIKKPADLSNHIVALDGMSGKVLYNYELDDEEALGYPESILITKDKGVVTYGMYFKGRQTARKNTAGMFFLKLNNEGKKDFFNVLPWKEAEDIIKVAGESDFLISGKSQILIQDIVQMQDGSYSIIGELFKRSSATTALGFLAGEDLSDRAFSIYDFVVFNYDSKGKLTTSYRIPKKEQNIELSGGIAKQKGLALSLLMRKYNMFSYQSTTDYNGKPHIVFTNVVEREKFIYRAPLEKPTQSTFPSAPAEYLFKKSEQEMSKLEVFSTQLTNLGAKLDKAITGTDQKFTYFSDPSYGFAVTKPDKVMVYFYDKDTKTLYMRNIGFKN